MEIQKLVALLAATAATLIAQGNWLGIQPGTSTRADVERVAGAPVQAVTQTLAEYKGAQPGDRAFVQYRTTGLVERVEVLVASPQDRAALLRTLGLGQPEVTRQNTRGLTEELYGSRMVVLTLGAGGVERVAYYSRELFEASGGRVGNVNTPGNTLSTVPGGNGSRLPPPIGGGATITGNAGTGNSAAGNTMPSTPGIGGGPGPGRVYSTTITIPAATKVKVYAAEKLSTARNKVGDKFTGTLADAIVLDDEAAGLKGETVAVKGGKVEGRIVSLAKSGRVKGVGELNLELTSVEVYGAEMVAVSTGSFVQTGEGNAGGDAKKAGGATGIGAAIGAIAGGGKGAAIGAGAGAAAAAGAILITRGKPAEVNVEDVLDFQLTLPVTVKRRLPQ